MNSCNPSIEQVEWQRYLRDQYEAAALGVELPEKPEPEPVNDDRPGVCRCCGKTRFIPRQWHVCRKCFNELEKER